MSANSPSPDPSDTSRSARFAQFGFVAQHWATAGLLGAAFLALHLPLEDGLRSDCPACTNGGLLARDRSRPAAAGDLQARPRSFAPLPVLTGLPGPASVLRTRPKAVAGEIDDAPGDLPDQSDGLPGTLATLAPFDRPSGIPSPRPSAVAGEIFNATPPLGLVGLNDPFNSVPLPGSRPTVLASAPTPRPPSTPPSAAPSTPTEPPPPPPPPPQTEPPPPPPPPPPAPPADVPLPGSAWLLLGGLAALWAHRRTTARVRGGSQVRG